MNKKQRQAQIRRRVIGAAVVGIFLAISAINVLQADGKTTMKVKTVWIDKPVVMGAGVAKVLHDYTAEEVPTDVKVVPLVEPRPINKEDMELLARLIHAEVGCVKDDECLYYCGSVVLNRVAADDFPNTIREVIFQTNPDIQYACTVDGNIKEDPTEREYEIAEDLLRYGSYIPEEVIYQSEFMQGSGLYIQIDNIYFCYR